MPYHTVSYAKIPSSKPIYRKLTQTIEGAHTDCVNCVRSILIWEVVIYNLQYYSQVSRL